jgi:xanthine/uracil permease
MFTLASGLAMGLMPILVPGVYSQFPQWSQMILGNGLAMGTITAALVNAMFQFNAPKPHDTGETAQ